MIVALLLSITALTLLSLIKGSSYLEIMLPGGLPIGNALTAIGLCAAAGAAVRLSAPRTLLRRLSVASLISAAIWLPASIALAGNLTLNFRGWVGGVWLALTAAIAGAIFAVLCWALIAAVLSRYRRAGAA